MNYGPPLSGAAGLSRACDERGRAGALADRRTPHVGLTVGLEDMGEAFAATATRRVTGRAVVTL